MTELTTFIEHEGGKLEAQQDCHDDTVIAMACANLGRTPASLRIHQDEDSARRDMEEDPFTLDGVIKEMTRGRGGFPIAPQHEGAWN
jgi:hypothetical protein